MLAWHGREFSEVALSLLVCWPKVWPFCKLYYNFGRYLVSKSFTDCIGMTVPLVVAPFRVAMDTSFCQGNGPFAAGRSHCTKLPNW